MCLAVPGQVLETYDDAFGMRMGRVSFSGIRKEVCLAYTPEVGVGDYVLVHVGFALNKVDEAEARRVFELLEALGEVQELRATGDGRDDSDAPVTQPPERRPGTTAAPPDDSPAPDGEAVP